MSKNILFSDSCRTNCWGGVEKWVVTMADSLRQRGYNTYLICRPKAIIEQKAHVQTIPTYNAGFNNSLDIFTVLKILKLIRNLNIDLIVCSTNLDIKLAGLAGKLAGIPVISRQGLALIPNCRRYKFLIRNFTSSIITNTHTIKKQYEDYGWFPQDHIQVIYNGVAPVQIPEKEDIINLKQQFITSPHEKIILSIGRLNPQKGFQFLIEVAKIAQEYQNPWVFLVLGNGREEKNILKSIKKNNLKNIQLLGFQNNVTEYYACSDLFVLTSLSEGTPNVVLEAMLNKCPVIATDVNGVKEIIENGKNGLIVPPMDSKAMYHAIKECIDQPKILENIIENAYQTVISKFTVENSTNQFIDYIINVTAKHEKNNHKNSQLSR